MDWDDLRIVRALGEYRTLEAAGEHLKLAPSTVFRRLQRIETALDARLFLRGRGGYSPTAVGETIMSTAAEVADRMAELELAIAGDQSALGGSLRLTTTDTLAGSVMDQLPGFRDAYPGISVEVMVNSGFLSLSRREADIAIRPTNAPTEHLVGRRVGSITFSVYRSADADAKDTGDPANWVAYDDSLSLTAGYRWMRKRNLLARPALVCNSIVSVQMAVNRGVGLGVLPDYLARADARLVRVEELGEDVATDLWILTHPDLRHTQRITAAMDHFAKYLKDVLLEAKKLPSHSS